jgi:hypothetical protein
MTPRKWLAETIPSTIGRQSRARFPAEADVGVMAFGLGKLADPLHEGERFPEVVESKRALDAAVVIAQLPIRSLALETQRFIARKRRNAAATRRASFLREGLGPIALTNATARGQRSISVIAVWLANTKPELKRAGRHHPLLALVRPG